MENAKLPAGVQEALNDWFGEEKEPAHFWQDSDKMTYYVLVSSIDNDLYCLRFFPLAGRIVVSQDNVVYGVTA